MDFKEIPVSELQFNPMTLIAKEWMLITAGNDKTGYNTMTASWGHLGSIWGHSGGKPTSVIFVRPQRYTKEFVDAQEYFTLSFFAPEYRPQLALCGSKSGRELDKVKECGFTVEYSPEGAPMFAQARLTLVCRKLYADDLKEGCFIDESLLSNYKAKDYHRFYICEIEDVLIRA